MRLDMKRFFATIGLMLFVDFFWISTGGRYSVKMHEHIQGSPVTFRYLGAAIVYPAMAYLFSWANSASDAFRIGLAAYAIYDFTNYALLKGYDWRFAIADSLWGGVLFMLVFLALQGLGL